MSIFDTVTFGPNEVRRVMGGDIQSVPRCVRMSILTSQTCGEACWHAREDVCRCSCGGRNHGCLLVPGGERPERTSKIDGIPYRLLAVGKHSDLYSQAEAINGAAYARIDPPEYVIDCTSYDHSQNPPRKYTKQDMLEARANGKDAWTSQGYSKWRETDIGAPARLKFASKDQMARWPELKGWQDQARIGVALLWERLEMPKPPTELKVDRDGNPLPSQSPIDS